MRIWPKMTFGRQPMAQTSLVPIRRPQRDGRVGQPGWRSEAKNLVSGAPDSQHLLQLRSMRSL